MKQTNFILLILLLGLISCQRQWYIAEADVEYIRFNKYAAEPDAEIEAIINPYKSQLDGEMNEVIGEVEHELTKRLPESTLGNFIADLLKIESEREFNMKIDFAAQNHGGLRIPSIPKGPLKKNKIYEVMPFDNTLVVIEAKGDVVKRLFDRIAVKGGWPVSKEVSFVIDNLKATEIEISGKPLDLNKTYRFSLPDYIANGGDECGFLQNEKRYDNGYFVRDAIIFHIEEMKRRNEKISASISGRIKKQ